jgi:superfamily II DNA or RNA helicase
MAAGYHKQVSPRATDPRRRWTLARVLDPYVTASVRSKGYGYYAAGAVTVVSATTEAVRASVRGTLPYDVEVLREGDGYIAVCTCPYYSDRADICKHIWATILAADAEGLLPPDGPEAWLDVDDTAIAGGAPTTVAPARARTVEAWERFLDGVLQQTANHGPAPLSRYTTGELLYVVDRDLTLQGLGVSITVLWRQRKKNGEWGKPQPAAISPAEVEQLPEQADREILATLAGAADPYAGQYVGNFARAAFRLVGPLTDRVLPMVAASRRFYLRNSSYGGDEMRPVAADPGEPWTFRLELSAPRNGIRTLSGSLVRGEERMGVREPDLVIARGYLIARGTLSRLEHGGAFAWLAELRRAPAPSFPDEAALRLLETFAHSQVDPAILPDDLHYEVVELDPVPRLAVERARTGPFPGEHQLSARVEFDYDGVIVPNDGRPVALDLADRRAIRRNSVAERQAVQRVQTLGFRRDWSPRGITGDLAVGVTQFGRAVRTLVAEGWHVEAEGAAFKTARSMNVRVRSGIDWFELHGDVDFGDGRSVPLTEILAALKRGEGTVRLDDGTRGMVPEAWLKRYVRIAGFGQVEGDHVRYRPSQTALLDALLEAQPDVDVDETFARARAALTSFSGVERLEPPPTFTGTLRDYQLDALGWFAFLRRFGFGGCLADDMGLGKTVMVLALLDARRTGQDGPRRPSLAVVPRSLVFNWMAEAKRFAPGLRVLDYSGPERAGASIEDHDLVLTTYGTLRRDAALMSAVEFDYVILDEAQAIKNAATASSKAVRLLRGRHRLALSGTPVENHIGELWSLFEFLNPGLLGTSSAFRRASLAQGRDGGEDLALVSRALKPLILRRTKDQVAPELPSRTEQTIYCELDEVQRRAYDDLRSFYRVSLTRQVEREGLAKSKMHVLEALLRLRQVASHLGLVRKGGASEPSAKFDVLIPQLMEVIDEGHKALVFSQFTELLGLLRTRLDASGVTYEYLDGRTKDRAERVERFSTDPACRLFLISLKAGGVGLNLTAAEYVFLLDPWWNPAAEAQAIDRAHRIGQSRHVFAYRLIAKDTVEEKVAQLQASKRQLADAILSADPTLIRNLKPEDLDLLLS